MSVHPSSVRVTPSNLSMNAWNASLRPSPSNAAPSPLQQQQQLHASSTKSMVSNASSNHRSRSRETPAQADRLKSPSKSSRARSVQPLQVDIEEYDSGSNNGASHPFAIPYQQHHPAMSGGSNARERSHSLSSNRAPDSSSKRLQAQSTSLAHSHAPALHTSRRFEQPRISRPLLSSGYIQTEGQEGLSLTEQYKLLQEQHQRLSSPSRPSSQSPTRQSPQRRQSPIRQRPHQQQQQQQFPLRPSLLQQQALNNSGNRSASRSRSNSRTNRLAGPPSNPQSPPLSPNLDEQEHSSIRSSLLEAESAANAPGPVVLTSPARGVNPSMNAALQNELSSLDQQIRQNTQELLIMQQQQHLQSLQQQQATIAAQMRESAAAAAQAAAVQSNPTPALPLPNNVIAPQPTQQPALQHFNSTQPTSGNWVQPQPVLAPSALHSHMQPASAIARSPSPVFRGSSASPFRSRSSSASFAHLSVDASAPTNATSHTLPASSPLATVPTPLVSKNNPFVSLVDAIDGVLAKSAAGASGAPMGANPASLQASPMATGNPTTALGTDGMSMNAAQQALQQFQFWQQQQQQLLAQQQQQQQLQTSQPLKTPIQLVSENHDFNQSSSTFSPPASLSNTATNVLQFDSTASTPVPAPVHSHHAPSHAPEPSSASTAVVVPAAVAPATPATAPSSSAPTTEEEAAELAAAGIESGVFDEHPELAAQNSVESLRLSNLLLRDKGTLLLKKHTALRLKFKAVRALLGEYYRRKDREVALVRMDTFVEHKVSHMKSKCLQHFRNLIQSHRRLVEKRKVKLNSLIRFSVAHQVAQERIALQLGFARWKEVALRLAMRAVQNQWMKDWEEDIAFESRRTKLASVLSRSSHRLEKQVFTIRSKAWAKWKTLTTYERVKDVFDKHGSSWASDRQALLQLVLEANENREILIRQTETQRIEYETLKGSYQQVSHIALQNNELINHIASLNQELSTLRDSAQHRRKATFDKAAKVLANAVWSIRCRKVRQSFAYWLTQIRIEKETQLQSQMAQIHQTLQATHAAQQQQEAAHAQSIAQLQNSFNQTMQQPSYALQQQQQNQRQSSQQSMSSPYSATISPQQAMNSQSLQLPNGSPMSDSFQMQPSPVTSIASPRTLQQLALDPTLAQFLPGNTNSSSTNAVDVKLAEFEAAKLQLEKETLSLAARLAATRMQQPAKSPASSPMMGMTLNNSTSMGMNGLPTPTVQPQLSPIDTYKFQQQIQEQQQTILALQQQQQQLRQAAELQRQQQQQPVLQQSPVAVIQPATVMPNEAHRSRSHSIHSIAPSDQTFVSLTQYAPPNAASAQTASLPGLHARELDDSVVVDTRTAYQPQQPQQQPQQPQQRIFQQPPPQQQPIAPVSPESPAMLAFAANTRVLSKDQLIQPPLIFDEDADSNASIVTQPSNSLPPYNTVNHNTNTATLQQQQPAGRAIIAPAFVPSAATNGHSHPSASPVSANSYKSSSTSNGVYSTPSTGMNGNHVSPSPVASAPTSTAPLTAANLAAASTTSSSAFSAQSPTRQALLQSVFSEFHRAYTARSRAAAGTSPFDASKFDNKLAMEDLPRALRKVGLRAGDLQTAKLSDADMNKLVLERGWNGKEFIEKDAFQQLAQSILFKLNF